MPFGNILGLWALLSLIPLIILYLRRPKPIDKIFPSLMFLVKETGAIRKYSFLKNLIRDFLLILQILVLVALAFSLAEPYIAASGSLLGQHNVLVIDASASSQTKVNGMTRFEKSIKEAENNVQGRTSIILAGTVPEIVLEKGSKGTALETLGKLKPGDSTTNLEAAMRSAETLVKKGKIIVISDFKKTEGQDPLVVKRILTSKNIPVEFIDVGGKAENIGIIDMAVSKYQTKVYVKNFKKEDEAVVIKLVKDKVMDEQTKTIKAGSVETVVFPTLPGVSKIESDAKDDFELDNKVFISSPAKMTIKVLLIANAKYAKDSQDYLRKALESSPEIELEVAEPPITPKLEGYDVIILGGVFSDLLLPSMFKDISTAVDNGTSFIVTAQDNLGNINFYNLLPVKIEGIAEEEARVKVNVVNKFTKDVDFSLIKVSKYFKTAADNSTVVIGAINNNPALVLKEKGNGKVVYFGVMDSYTDFKLSPDYPIFWNLLLNFLTGTERISDYNLKIEDKPQLKKIGYYQEKNKKLAVNLLSEKESDVSKEKLITEEEGGMDFEGEREQAKTSFELALLILASLIILAELIYIKKRGDL